MNLLKEISRVITGYETKEQKFAAELEASIALHEQALLDLKAAHLRAQQALETMMRAEVAEALKDDRPDGLPEEPRAKRLPRDRTVFLPENRERDRLQADVTYYSSEIGRIEKKLIGLRRLAPQ